MIRVRLALPAKQVVWSRGDEAHPASVDTASLPASHPGHQSVVLHQPLFYRAPVTIDLDTEAVQLTILHCGYHARCRVRGCSAIATTILRKADRAGRFLRQIEVCDAHGADVIARETTRGLQVVDWRDPALTRN